jgi:hypothetical protein
MIDQYQRYLETHKPLHGIAIAAACIASFYASYLLAAAGFTSIIVYHLLFRRRELGVKDLNTALISISILFFACAPYAIINRIWTRSDDMASHYSWLGQHIKLLVWNFRDVNVTCCLPWTIFALLCFLLLLFRKSPEDREFRSASIEWLTILIVYLSVIALLSPQSLDFTNSADMRYMVPILPFACGLSGIAVAMLFKRLPWIAALLLFVMTTTNALTLTNLGEQVAPSTTSFRQTLPSLIDEESHPYPTANSEVVKFLNKRAKQGDVITTIPFFEAYPIMFYLGDKLTICQPEIHGIKNSPRPKRVNIPNAIFSGPQDWIISFSSQPINLMQAAKLINRSSFFMIEPNGQIQHKTFHSEGYLKVYCVQTQRPELTSHEFGPVDHDNSNANGVTLFHTSIESVTKEEMLREQETVRRNFHIDTNIARPIRR